MGAGSTPYADSYLELSFASANLPSSGATVHFRIHDSSYRATYNQSNDWSFFSYSGSTGNVAAIYTTAYLRGVLAWGTEPGSVAPDAGRAPRDAGGD